VAETRTDPAVDAPASIRSSIGIARFAAERARRTGVPVDAKLLAQAARLILTEAVKLKPGRKLDVWLDSLLTKTLGTSG
jgi:hypothetical protein